MIVTDGLKMFVRSRTQNARSVFRVTKPFRDELVQSASRVVGEIGNKLRQSPLFLFVDEFQDTDSEQIGMITSIRNKCNARIFVVGDQKQGSTGSVGPKKCFGQLRHQQETRVFFN